jgi:ornithine carbamoyltransferase
VLEGSRSRVWPQAENRMHAARGALVWLMEQR